MADKPIQSPLAADLPENWSTGQIVAPAGSDVGLSQQHGYNYLMKQVNAAQETVNTINNAFEGLASQEDLKDLNNTQGKPGGLATLGADGKLTDGQVPDASKVPYESEKLPSAANVKQALDSLKAGLDSGTVTARKVTAAAAGWSGELPTQSLAVEGVAADTLCWVGLDSSATPQQRDAARKAVICPTGQGPGTITLACDGVRPAVDLPILIYVSGGVN